jgi:hypothetical protein
MRALTSADNFCAVKKADLADKPGVAEGEVASNIDVSGCLPFT